MDTIREEVPIERGKVIAYGGVGSPLVMTEYVVVACCTRIGTHLAKQRRLYADWATDGRYSVAWEKMSEQTKKLKGEEIRLLCAADRVPGREE